MITLESSKLFSRLPTAELQNLRKEVRELTFKPDELIFKEGDPGNGVYVVKSGQVQISGLTATGDRLVFSRVAPGDVFGEMTLLENRPRSACASAESDTILYFVPREPMVGLLRRSPELSLTLVTEISDRLRDFNRQYINQVLQAERMALVGRFASAIVHDLKNPLTIIGIAADLGCSPESTPDSRKVAKERIQKQVDRITYLVNDILEFTRGVPNEVPLGTIDFGRYMKALLEELQSEVELKGVRITLQNPPPSAPIRLHPQRMSRVLHNLIGNAVDAMPGGGKILVSFRQEPNQIVTEVKDSGPGIPAEIQERLFEAFATFGKARGTGLGLSICRKIVEEHGGKISAWNDGGAVFSFSLPTPHQT